MKVPIEEFARIKDLDLSEYIPESVNLVVATLARDALENHISSTPEPESQDS